MARQPRLVIPGLPHHVFQRGHNRQDIFLSDADRMAWKAMMVNAMHEAKVQVHAYAMMSNHFHLLVTPPDSQGLSRGMQMLGRSYVSRFNTTYGRSGTLWEGRFKAMPIEEERYYLLCMRYIELNPVRAGLVTHASGYEWSSARHHLGLAEEPYIHLHPLYWRLGNTPFDRQNAYAQLLSADLPESDLQALHASVQRGLAMGTPSTLDAWCEKFSRHLHARPRGRPSKSKNP